LKVVPSCSQDGTSYLLLQTLWLYDVSFSYKAHELLKASTADFRHQSRWILNYCKYNTHAYHGYSRQRSVPKPYMVYRTQYDRLSQQ